MPDVDAHAVRADRRRRLGSGFWAVAFAFLIVMAFATLPSPLYGLYRTRDHLSAFMITVVFAIFAGGTIITLLGERFIAARFGRRGALLGGVGTAAPASRAATDGGSAGPRRKARLPVPAAAATIAVFVGLSVPVIGAGVALAQGASAPDTVPGFAVLVALGVLGSGWALLGGQSARSQQVA